MHGTTSSSIMSYAFGLSRWLYRPGRNPTTADGNDLAARVGDVSMSVPHVGYGPTPLVLPPGSIVSLSLTRWWAPPDTRHIPERCYVQICDVVDVPAKPTAPVVHAEDALSDVPF